MEEWRGRVCVEKDLHQVKPPRRYLTALDDGGDDIYTERRSVKICGVR